MEKEPVLEVVLNCIKTALSVLTVGLLTFWTVADAKALQDAVPVYPYFDDGPMFITAMHIMVGSLVFLMVMDLFVNQIIMSRPIVMVILSVTGLTEVMFLTICNDFFGISFHSGVINAITNAVSAARSFYASIKENVFNNNIFLMVIAVIGALVVSSIFFLLIQRNSRLTLANLFSPTITIQIVLTTIGYFVFSAMNAPIKAYFWLLLPAGIAYVITALWELGIIRKKETGLPVPKDPDTASDAAESASQEAEKRPKIPNPLKRRYHTFKERFRDVTGFRLQPDNKKIRIALYIVLAASAVLLVITTVLKGDDVYQTLISAIAIPDDYTSLRQTTLNPDLRVTIFALIVPFVMNIIFLFIWNTFFQGKTIIGGITKFICLYVIDIWSAVAGVSIMNAYQSGAFSNPEAFYEEMYLKAAESGTVAKSFVFFITIITIILLIAMLVGGLIFLFLLGFGWIYATLYIFIYTLIFSLFVDTGVLLMSPVLFFLVNILVNAFMDNFFPTDELKIPENRKR